MFTFALSEFYGIVFLVCFTIKRYETKREMYDVIQCTCEFRKGKMHEHLSFN